MKTRLFAITALLLLALLALPSAPRVFAQGCSPISSVYGTGAAGSNYYLSFGSVYPDPPNVYGPWWRAGDYHSYEVVVNANSAVVDLHWFDTTGAYVGVRHSFPASSSYAVFSMTVNTGSIAVISTAPFDGYVCLVYGGTATPVPPTATPVPPTATPVVVVTATPVPPTPTPAISTEVYLSNIQAVQENNFKWSIFAGTVGVGLLVLMFVRVAR